MTDKQLKQGQKLKAEIDAIQNCVNALKMAVRDCCELNKAELQLSVLNTKTLENIKESLKLNKETIALMLPYYTELLESKRTEFNNL